MLDITINPSVNAPVYAFTAISYNTHIEYTIIAPGTTIFLCLVKVYPSRKDASIGINSIKLSDL